MPVFSGLVRGDRRTNIIPGAKVEDEARIHKNQVSGEMEAVGPVGHNGARNKIIQDLGLQEKNQLGPVQFRSA